MKLAFYADRHISMRSLRFEYALSMWDWVIDDAIAQGATAFIGLGDVCEGDPNGAERMALGLRYQRMLKHGPVAEVVGNHESSDGLAWLSLLGVVVAWDQIIPLEGDVVDVLLAPYARKGHAPYNNLGEGLSMAEASYAAAMRLREAVVDAKRGHIPLVVAGHWTVAGTRMGESDVEIHSTTEMIVPVGALTPASLVVTGHIHSAQEIEPNIVVAGSLYRCSFAEAAEEKSYVLVTVDKKGRVTWERRIIPCRAMFVDTLDWPLTVTTRAALTDPRALDWFRGQEVKLTVRVGEDQLGTFDPSVFDAVKDVASYFVLERETVSMQRSRAPEIAAADTPAMQLHRWFQANDQEPQDAAHWARLTAKLAEVTAP